MGAYFLEVYKDENLKEKLERYEFDNREEFIAWADKNEKGKNLNDQVSSFQYCLPIDWALSLYIDRDPNGKKTWILPGTGEVKKVKKMKKGFGDSVSGHKWVKLFALIVYDDNKWKNKLMKFPFEYREEFVAWPDKNENGEKVSDRVSSCEYHLPKGWEVHIYKNRNPKDKSKNKFVGTGKKIKIKDSEFFADKVSAHKWVKQEK